MSKRIFFRLEDILSMTMKRNFFDWYGSKKFNNYMGHLCKPYPTTIEMLKDLREMLDKETKRGTMEKTQTKKSKSTSRTRRCTKGTPKVRR